MSFLKVVFVGLILSLLVFNLTGCQYHDHYIGCPEKDRGTYYDHGVVDPGVVVEENYTVK